MKGRDRINLGRLTDEGCEVSCDLNGKAGRDGGLVRKMDEGM